MWLKKEHPMNKIASVQHKFFSEWHPNNTDLTTATQSGRTGEHTSIYNVHNYRYGTYNRVSET